jgi:hypothetical protein
MSNISSLSSLANRAEGACIGQLSNHDIVPNEVEQRYRVFRSSINTEIPSVLPDWDIMFSLGGRQRLADKF